MDKKKVLSCHGVLVVVGCLGFTEVANKWLKSGARSVENFTEKQATNQR